MNATISVIHNYPILSLLISGGVGLLLGYIVGFDVAKEEYKTSLHLNVIGEQMRKDFARNVESDPRGDDVR